MSKNENTTDAKLNKDAGTTHNPPAGKGRRAAPLHTIARQARAQKEARHVEEKRKQPGVGFPSAGAQSNLLIVRLGLSSSDAPTVREGLRRLCGLFERIDTGEKRIDVLEGGKLERVPLKAFHFSATVGFGMGFFQMLNIPAEKRPAKLKLMPDNTVLLDPAPYVLGQTDLIIQLGSSQDFINRWVLENALEPHELAPDEPASPPAADVPDDIVTAIRGWAVVSDVHAGFQRTDGRNLLGFNDGVSNPRRLSPLFDQTVWTTAADEGDRPDFVDGTYMVFQKIAHDLDQWRALDRPTQEAWIGRSKGTGLLLGTLPPEEDAALALALRSNDPAVRDPAVEKWESLFKPQTDPAAPFYDHVGGDQHPYEGEPVHGDIPNRCPMWSHVRKANQRQEDGQYTPHYIFRRGYPYVENGPDNTTSAGLLFVCFQHDLQEGFEFVKTVWLNSPGFPVPLHDAQFVVDGHQVVPRVFTPEELRFRHSRGRFTADELKALTPDQRQLLGYADDNAYRAAIAQAAGDPRTQETGREGLGGPSVNGVNVDGEQVSTVALGGGYYFVPPIPDQNMTEIGQQFFG